MPLCHDATPPFLSSPAISMPMPYLAAAAFSQPERQLKAADYITHYDGLMMPPR